MLSKIKKTKYFWAIIAAGAILILFAGFLLPVWGTFWEECPWKDLGLTIVNYIMASLILLYLFGYLLKKVLSNKGTIQILTIVEFSLLFLIALGLVLSEIIGFVITDNPSIILGIALYIRGVVEIIKGYFYQKSVNEKHHIGWVILAILLVTGGTVLFVTNYVDKVTVLWIIIASLVLLGAVGILWGILAKPETKKEVKTTKTTKTVKKQNKIEKE